VFEELGAMDTGASDAELHLVEIPDDVKWTIQDYDGVELVAEIHHTWN
jgi:hypothetical protein